MKKIINITVRSLLVVCLLVCAFAVASKAKAEVVSSDVAVLGAQVRTEGQAGLRFVGAYTGSDEVAKYGIAVALGNVSAEAVKAGAKAEVSAQDEDGHYYVTVYNIPEAAYTQEISALAYVVLADESVVWSEEVAVKNLAATSLAAANAGEMEADDLIDQVVEYVEANYKKVQQDVHGNIYIDSAVYESNHKELAKAFVKDWNALFGTELDAETAFVTTNYDSPFRKSARNQSTTEASGNLVTFFNDEKMSVRWGWMLDYILSELTDGTGYSNCKYIIGLIRGTTTNNGSENWYFGFPLISYIQSIFNAKGTSSGSGQYKFESSAASIRKLGKIEKYNNAIYANLSDAELVEIGYSAKLSELTPANGYAWVGWNDGSAKHNGEITVGVESLVLMPAYAPVEYTITYMDGDTVIESLSSTYTIESLEIVLPNYEKEGFGFSGWYSNDALEGTAVTSISAGSTGNKVFYAKTVELAVDSVLIEYVYCDYDFDQLLEEFKSDWTTYSDSGKRVFDMTNTTDRKTTYAQWLAVKAVMANSTFVAKYEWLLTTVANAICDKNPYYKTQIKNYLTNGASAITDNTVYYHFVGELTGFWNQTKFLGTATYVEVEMTDWTVESTVAAAQEVISSKYTIKQVPSVIGEVLLTPERAGYTFAGWYANADYSGEALTVAPSESCTLYAKWVAAE